MMICGLGHTDLFVISLRRYWVGSRRHLVNPRHAGPLDFPPPAGVFEHPRLSRLLRIVEQNGKRRSKAREKSFRNHLGHFLPQVKIEVTRGQNSKIFTNGFWRIKSLILKVEQRF